MDSTWIEYELNSTLPSTELNSCCVLALVPLIILNCSLQWSIALTLPEVHVQIYRIFQSVIRMGSKLHSLFGHKFVFLLTFSEYKPQV